MILGTVETWQLDEGDFVVIDNEECTIFAVNDEGDTFVITYIDGFGEKVTEEFPSEWVFEIWGN